jgi:hypothetical protein
MSEQPRGLEQHGAQPDQGPIERAETEGGQQDWPQIEVPERRGRARIEANGEAEDGEQSRESDQLEGDPRRGPDATRTHPIASAR